MILKRIEGERFSEVLPAWRGETVALIAGGPSLTQDQIDQVREAKIKCIVVNDSYLRAPFADLLYFADSHWWTWQREGKIKPGYTLADWNNFKGQRCTIQNSGANVTDESVHMLRNRDFPIHGVGLSKDPRVLVTGRNSGFQAFNLAILSGVKRILLLGYDAKKAEDGKTHWHAGHPIHTPDAAYDLYRKAFSTVENEVAAMGIKVFNCSTYSTIGFPKSTVAQAI